MKEFAGEYGRDGNGWIHFPRDIERRRATFPSRQTCPHTYEVVDSETGKMTVKAVHDVFDHPAKMNLYLVDCLIDYLTEPGEWILDPFGGTGSSALGIQQGRNVYLIDVEEQFIELVKETASLMNPDGEAMDMSGIGLYQWLAKEGSGYGELRFQLGDNRKVLASYPDNARKMDACITSPPYSTALNPGSNPLEVKGREGTLAGYTRNARNMGTLNPFFWKEAMKELWVGMFRVIRPGGLVAMVNKDIVKNGARETLSTELIRQGQDAGFEYKEWFKWAPPSTIRQETARNKGGVVLEDEDIIVFRRP